MEEVKNGMEGLDIANAAGGFLVFQWSENSRSLPDSVTFLSITHGLEVHHTRARMQAGFWTHCHRAMTASEEKMEMQSTEGRVGEEREAHGGRINASRCELRQCLRLAESNEECSMAGDVRSAVHSRSVTHGSSHNPQQGRVKAATDMPQ